MCVEVAFQSGKSLRQSDGLWETVPDRRTGNRKGSVSEVGSRLWNNEGQVAGVMPGRYRQMQLVLSGTRGSDCREP